MGVIEEIMIKLGDLYMPVDFVILEVDKDTCTLSFLGALSWPPSGTALM